MATGNNRLLWKGAIAFGLVHIPIGLHSATRDQSIDFDWLDKRTMDPVGYKRINKRTGKEIERDDITKGVAQEDGQYVVVTPEEISAAFPVATQTIEIERFVDASDIPFIFLDRPYYVTPIHKGLKVYMLLRDALQSTGKIGLAKVVIQTKQHLAALVPSGKLLVLNLLRWGNEIKPQEDIELPDLPAKTGISTAEMKMATQLIAEMSGKFEPAEFRDEFREGITKLIEMKVEKGEVERVEKPADPGASGATGNIVDLTALLRRSLKGDGDDKASKDTARQAAKPAPAKRGKSTARTPKKSTAAKKKAA